MILTPNQKDLVIKFIETYPELLSVLDLYYKKTYPGLVPKNLDEATELIASQTIILSIDTYREYYPPYKDEGYVKNRSLENLKQVETTWTIKDTRVKEPLINYQIVVVEKIQKSKVGLITSIEAIRY